MQALIPSSPQPILTSTLPLPQGVNGSLKPVTVKRKPMLKKGNRMIANPRAGETTVRLVSTAPARAFKEEAIYILRDYHQTFCDWSVVQDIRHRVDCEVWVPLALTMDFYLPLLKRRDEDGGVKAVQDAIFNHLELNDTMVVDLHVRKFMDATRPRVEIKLSELM